MRLTLHIFYFRVKFIYAQIINYYIKFATQMEES